MSSERASEARCLSPLDSDPHRSSARSARPTADSASKIRACRPGSPYSRAKKSRFSATVSRVYRPGASVVLAVLLPLLLGLGWRASLLLAAACYPLVILAAAGFGPSFGRLPQTLGTGPMPAPVAHTIIVTILYLPPMLVLCRAMA